MAIDTATDTMALRNKQSLAVLLPTCPVELPLPQYGPHKIDDALLPWNTKEATAAQRAERSGLEESRQILADLVDRFNDARNARMAVLSSVVRESLVFSFRAGRITRDWAARVFFVLNETPVVERLGGFVEIITAEMCGVVLVVYIRKP